MTRGGDRAIYQWCKAANRWGGRWSERTDCQSTVLPRQDALGSACGVWCYVPINPDLQGTLAWGGGALDELVQCFVRSE